MIDDDDDGCVVGVGADGDRVWLLVDSRLVSLTPDEAGELADELTQARARVEARRLTSAAIAAMRRKEEPS